MGQYNQYNPNASQSQRPSYAAPKAPSNYQARELRQEYSMAPTPTPANPCNDNAKPTVGDRSCFMGTFK